MATYIKTITAVLLLCPVLLFSQSKVVNMGSATKATPSFTSNDTAAYGLPYTIQVISGKSYKTSQSATIIITDNGANAITDILLDGQYTYGSRSVSISSVKVYGSDTVTLVSSEFTDIGLYNITISVQNPGHSVTIGGLTYRQYIEFGTGSEVLADTASAIRSDIPAGGIDRAELADSTEAVRNDFPTAGVDSAMLADTAAAIRGDFPSPGGGGGITDVTYAQLLAAISGGTLSPGGWYRITDFRTVHYFSDNESTIDTAINVGALEPLIVFATSDTAIANRAYSEAYPQDVIYYDYDSTHFLDDYSFSVDGGGDSIVNGFKGVITYRWDTDLDNSCGYDYRNVKFRRWALDPDDWSSSTTYAAKSIVQDGGKIYISLDTTTNNIPASYVNDWVEIVDMTSNNYWAWRTGTCNGIKVDGSDFADFYTFGSGTCYMNHIATGPDNVDDWNTNGSRLNNIVIGSYSYMNDISFGCYEVTIGSGLRHNSIGHYFCQNLISENFKYNTICNTFGGNVVYKNFISNTVGNGFNANRIGYNFNSNNLGEIFDSNILGENCMGNFIGNNFNHNSIASSFYYNQIGNGFSLNIVANDFVYNILNYNFSGNIIGYSFGTNAIGIDFTSNIIGHDFKYNTIGCGTYGNHVGIFFTTNVIGNRMISNTIGDNFEYNTVGNNFSGDTIGSNVVRCDIKDKVINTNFTSETLMTAAYNKTIQVCSDGTAVISYIDCTGAPTYTVRAVTLPGGGD